VERDVVIYTTLMDEREKERKKSKRRRKGKAH
jgi:hypothetical protein